MPTQAKPFTAQQIEEIIADRMKHPEMTTIEWAKQYPISTVTYYNLKTRLKKLQGAKKAKASQPNAPKAKAVKPAKSKGNPMTDFHTFQLWKKLGTRYLESIPVDQLPQLMIDINKELRA
jgi:hypothetical protein